MQVSDDYFNELVQDSHLLKVLTAQNEEVAQLVERLDVALNGESSVERSLLDLVQQVEAMPREGCQRCRTATRAKGYAMFCLDCAQQMADHFDLEAHLYRQMAFSQRTFGPGRRTQGVVDHIRKELNEITKAPADLYEWIDVIILGFDGAWRAGHSPHLIIDALVSKQAKNESRDWPDWRTADTTKAIEHVRSNHYSHPDDIAVDKFAAAMKEKLAKKRDEGRGGWDDREACPDGFLQGLLLRHLSKGDPIDVGNFAMMIWNRGDQVYGPRQFNTSDSIPVPRNVEQAREMAILGNKWLSENAPDQLSDPT